MHTDGCHTDDYTDWSDTNVPHFEQCYNKPISSSARYRRGRGWEDVLIFLDSERLPELCRRRSIEIKTDLRLSSNSSSIFIEGGEDLRAMSSFYSTAPSPASHSEASQSTADTDSNPSRSESQYLSIISNLSLQPTTLLKTHQDKANSDPPPTSSPA